MTLTITGFPACCGASVVTGFSSNPKDVVTFKMERKSVDDPFYGRTSQMAYVLDKDGNRIVEQTVLDKFKADLARFNRTHPDRLYTCVLNSAQYNRNKKEWPRVLKKLGFEHVRTWNNSGHGKSHCRLFVLVTNVSGSKVKDPYKPPEGWGKFPGPDEPESEKAGVVASLTAMAAAITG
jgi:hypothetical protein